MKTTSTIALLLITIAMFGQKDDGFISSKAYRIEQVSNITIANKDTTDFTDFFTEDNGFIILMHYDHGQDLFSVDRGDSDKLMFLGGIKDSNVLEGKDSIEFISDGMARGGDTLQHAIVRKIYHVNSFEETGEKIYSFQLIFKDEIWNFIATEIITGKKEI